MAVDKARQQDGYWTATVLPIPRLERRFHQRQLVDRLSEASVALRGWNYPHIPREDQDLTYRGEWLEGRTDWGRYQEVWRFHTDGLFVHRWRLREDGTDYRGTFHLVAAIYTVTEVWEFARRLYGHDVAVDQVRVGLQLDNVGGRIGVWSSADDLPFGVQARQNRFDHERTVPRLDLFANVRDLAVETTTQMFRELGFGVSEAYVFRRTEDFLAGRF